MAEKRILIVDGESLEGFVSMDEPTIEKGVVEVPGLNKTTPVANGVKVIPQIPAVFKITRNSKTLKILQDWFEQAQTKDCVLVRMDQGGQEFSRELWTNTEISRFNGASFDAQNPIFAQQHVTFLPEDIIPISAE